MSRVAVRDLGHLAVQRSNGRGGFDVTPDGVGSTSRAGTVAARELAGRLGVPNALEAAVGADEGRRRAPAGQGAVGRGGDVGRRR